jgi:hypothetical protein
MAGVAIIALVVGLAFGGVALPVTKTSTQLSTVTEFGSRITVLSTILATPTTSQLTIITITYQPMDVYAVTGSCTTISGTATVVYSYMGSGGETTTATYIYPTEYQYHPTPPEFIATVVTETTAVQSNHTQPFTGACG